MLDLPLLSRTMRDCGVKLPRTANVGASSDWGDLYYLLDYLTFALDRTYETQPCKAGCSLCCRENAVFRVSEREWAAIEAFLREQEPSFVSELLERNRTTFEPHHEQLRQVAEFWRDAPALSEINPHLEGLPSVCSALVDDRCSIYDARPLVCRAYGYFALKVRETETLMICKPHGKEFLDSLKAQGLENAPLPNFEPFERQMRRINGAGAVKPLPLWLLEWDPAAPPIV